MSDTEVEAGSSSCDLGALLESAAGTDVTLVAGGSEFPAHSLILAARSPVFAAMLRNDMKEARSHRIEIEDVGDDVLRQMLSFIYTDTVPELGSVAAELLAAADKYDLPLLKRRCEDRLARDLTAENAGAAAALAVVHRCPGLRDAAVQFVAGHPEVMESAGWAKVLRENTEAAVEVCRRLAQTRPPDNRILTKEHRQFLAEKLVSAASDGRIDELRALLQLGAPVDVKGGDGDSALHKAVVNGQEGAVSCLVDAGADVNIRDSTGRTPLHRAAWKSQPQHAIWILLGASALTDVQDNSGETPLHKAVRNASVYSTKALLLAGARRDVRDKNAKTPADMATGDISTLFNTIK